MMSKQFMAKVVLEVDFEINIDDDTMNSNDIIRMNVVDGIDYLVVPHVSGWDIGKVNVVGSQVVRSRRLMRSSFTDSDIDLERTAPTMAQYKDMLLPDEGRELREEFVQSLRKENVLTHEERVKHVLKFADEKYEGDDVLVFIDKKCEGEHDGFDCCEYMWMLSTANFVASLAEARMLNKNMKIPMRYIREGGY